MARSLLSRPPRPVLLLALTGATLVTCVETGAEVCGNGFLCALGERCVDIGRYLPLCVLGTDTTCVFEVSDGRVLSVPCPAGNVCDTDLADCVSVAQYEACTGQEDLTPCNVPGYGPGSLRCRDQVCTALTCGDGYVNPEADEACDPRSDAGCNPYCQEPVPVPLDLLLVIDPGPGMTQPQDVLAVALEPFVQALADAADLNVELHLAITTADASSDCSGTPCTKDPVSGEPAGGYYVDAPPLYCGANLGADGKCRGDGCASSTANCRNARETLSEEPGTGCPRCRNLPGETWVPDGQHPVKWGQSGSAYSASLQALVAAVGPNGAFRREGAVLAVVVLAARDDCSPSTPLFYALEGEPETSYRCFAHGTACADATEVPGVGTTYSGCEGFGGGYLRDPAELAESFSTALDADATPLDVIVQVLAGVPGDDATAFVSADLEVAPVCDLEASAEPGFRLRGFVEAVRALRGLDDGQVRLDSLCGSTAELQFSEFQAVLDRILERVRAHSIR